MPEFSIATLTQEERKIVYEAEKLFKQKTGKDCVMIAWEKK